MPRARPRSPRSSSAEGPRDQTWTSPQNRRRTRTAHVAVRKDTMMLETDHGPRVVWGVTKPKIKKR